MEYEDIRATNITVDLDVDLTVREAPYVRHADQALGLEVMNWRQLRPVVARILDISRFSLLLMLIINAEIAALKVNVLGGLLRMMAIGRMSLSRMFFIMNMQPTFKKK